MTDVAIAGYVQSTIERRAGHRTYTYEPTYILRGLTELHLRFNPVVGETGLGGGERCR